MRNLQNYRQKRRAAGLCALCGKVKSDGYACAGCQAKNRERKHGKSKVIGAAMTDLSTSEKRELSDLVAVVDRGQETFVQVGEALATIRDKKLYRQEAETFEGFCKERWGFTRIHAYRLIGAAEVANEVSVQSENCNPRVTSDEPPAPTNERQARELSEAPKGERAKVWKKAVASAPKSNGKPKVTAAHVRRVVQEESTNGEHKSNGKPGQPFDEFNAGLDELLTLARSLRTKVTKYLEYKTTSDRSPIKWAAELDKKETVGNLSHFIRHLEDDRPARIADVPRGFMTVHEMTPREQAFRAARLGGAR